MTFCCLERKEEGVRSEGWKFALRGSRFIPLDVDSSFEVTDTEVADPLPLMVYSQTVSFRYMYFTIYA